MTTQGEAGVRMMMGDKVHQNTPEVRWDGRWYAMTSDAFEPDLPGTVVWSPGAGE